MSNEIKIKKSTLFWIFLSIILIIFWIFGSTEKTTTFLFESEIGERFDGSVYINDYFIGNTKNGEIKVSRQISLTDEVTFEGNYDSDKFIFYYEFEVEDLNLSEITFPIKKEEIIDYVKRSKDNFANITYTHWGHMPLTYRFENEEQCFNWQPNLFRSAFNNITLETDGIISFVETTEYEDISIYCKPSQINTRTGEGAIADAIPIMHSDYENLIIYGEINIYGQGDVCGTGYPALEVHEILHLFDFPHNPLKNSVMAQYSAESFNKCKVTKIDKEYISCLKYIYSNGEIEGNCAFPNVID